MRIVVIGCGKIALAGHLPALAGLQSEGLVAVTVCDADPAKASMAADRFGVPATADWRSAAATADAVAVCVPPGPNAEIATEAVAMGLHVLCEKPPGRSVEQAEAMASAARQSDRVTMLGFNRRFNPLYQRAMARSSELGPPTSFYSRFSRAALGQPPSDTATDWLTSDSAHAFDVAIATMGFPHAVVVARKTVGAGPDNAWTVQLHTEQGSALVLLHYAAGRRAERYEWFGPGYEVALDLPERAEWVQPRGSIEVWHGPDVAGSAQHLLFGFDAEYRAFLDACAGEEAPPACDFAYGARFMRLVRMMLDAPSGTLATVPDRVLPDTSHSIEDSVRVADARSDVGRAEGRPTVLMNYSSSSQQRFFSAGGLAELATRCNVRNWTGTDDDRVALEAAHVVVTGRGSSGLPQDFLAHTPNLALVVALGASVRHLQPETLLARRVVVCNTADAVAESVAEHCLMVTLAALRRLTEIDRKMHAGEWPGAAPTASSRHGVLPSLARLLPLPRPLRSRLARMASGRGGRMSTSRVRGSHAAASERADLRGEVVGLVGWGHTARRFAALLEPFDCEVLVFSEGADADELRKAGVRRASLGEVLGSATVISLHRGLTEETKGFLDANRLAQIKAGSVLVNTARADLVDTSALLDRLRGGDIAAALDVFEEEPLPKRHPLRNLDNVILTPHSASATGQEARRIGDLAIRTIFDWLEGAGVGIDAARLARMS